MNNSPKRQPWYVGLFIIVAVIAIGALYIMLFGGHNQAPSGYQPSYECSQAAPGYC